MTLSSRNGFLNTSNFYIILRGSYFMYLFFFISITKCRHDSILKVQNIVYELLHWNLFIMFRWLCWCTAFVYGRGRWCSCFDSEKVNGDIWVKLEPTPNGLMLRCSINIQKWPEEQLCFELLSSHDSNQSSLAISSPCCTLLFSLCSTVTDLLRLGIWSLRELCRGIRPQCKYSREVDLGKKCCLIVWGNGSRVSRVKAGSSFCATFVLLGTFQLHSQKKKKCWGIERMLTFSLLSMADFKAALNIYCWYFQKSQVTVQDEKLDKNWSLKSAEPPASLKWVKHSIFHYRTEQSLRGKMGTTMSQIFLWGITNVS